jgi:hypothetical protein
MDNRSKAIGLIVIGLLLLLINADWLYLEFYDLWPLLIIAVAIMIFRNWQRQKDQGGLLFTAVLLLLLGIFFFSLVLINWQYMHFLWPFFILLPGLAFLSMYIFVPGNGGALIPAMILIAVASVFLLLASPWHELWPLILIIAGIIFLLFGRKVGANGST